MKRLAGTKDMTMGDTITTSGVRVVSFYDMIKN